MSDDAELLQRYAAEKSEMAFTALVERHVDLVYSAALRRLGGDAHGAADVTQQVFVRLARQASALARGVVLPAWLYATTRNVAVDYVRAEQRRRAREQEAHMRQQLDANETAAADWERLRPLLDHAMDELGERDREAVLLRFFARRPFAEIGRALHVSEDAARMRVDRALERLRLQLARRGITSSVAALGVMLTAQSAVAAPASLAGSVAQGAMIVAAAGTGVSAGGGGLIFMSMSKLTVGVAAALGVIGIGCAIVELQRARKAEAESVGLRREQQGLRQDLSHTEDLLKTAEAARRDFAGRYTALEARAAAGDAGTRSDGAVGSRRTEAPSSAPSPGPSMADVTAASPEYLQLAAKYFRASLGLNFGPLYRRLGLSQNQITALENAMMEQFQANQEVRAAAVAQHISVTDPSLAPLIKQLEAAYARKVVEIVGADGARQVGAYSKVVEIRASTIDALAGNLYYTDTPLTAAQAEQLIQIVAKNTGDLKRSGTVYSSPDANWDAILRQAESLLAPAQISALRALREKAELQKQIGDLYATLLRGTK